MMPIGERHQIDMTAFFRQLSIPCFNSILRTSVISPEHGAQVKRFHSVEDCHSERFRVPH